MAATWACWTWSPGTCALGWAAGLHHQLVQSPLGEAAEVFDAHEHRFGIHAGAIETSLMLAIRPALVRMDQADNFSSTSEQRAARFPTLGNGRSAKLAWQIQDYHPSGAVGNAAAADAERGAALLEATGRALAALLQEIDALPPDTLRSGASAHWSAR